MLTDLRPSHRQFVAHEQVIALQMFLDIEGLKAEPAGLCCKDGHDLNIAGEKEGV